MKRQGYQPLPQFSDLIKKGGPHGLPDKERPPEGTPGKEDETASITSSPSEPSQPAPSVACNIPIGKIAADGTDAPIAIKRGLGRPKKDPQVEFKRKHGYGNNRGIVIERPRNAQYIVNPTEAVAEAGQVKIDYRPHPKQQVFAEAIEKVMKIPVHGPRVVLFIAGVRSGKSFGGAYESAKQIYIYQKPTSPNLGYIVAPTVNMSRVPKRLFEQALGGAVLRYRRASDDGPPTFRLLPSPAVPDYEYIAEVHTGEHPQRLSGASVAWAWLDEARLMKSEVYDVVRARLMENDGICLITTSPPPPGHWVKTDVFDRAYRCGVCHECVYDHGQPGHEPSDCYGDQKVAVVRCSTFDNTYQTQEAIEELRREYALKDPVIARRELFAEFAGFEGIVYQAFDKRSHRSPFSHREPPPKEARFVGAIDFGAQDPFVAVFLCKHNGTWHVVDEYYYVGPPRSMQEHYEEITRRPFFRRVQRWWYDPSAKQGAVDLMKFGLKKILSARKSNTTSKQSWRNWRFDVVNSWLRAKDERGVPRLLFSDTVPCTVKDFENRKRKRYQAKGDDGRVRVVDNKGHEIDRNAGDDFAPGYDHGTDAVEYALCSEEIMAKYAPKEEGVTPKIDILDAMARNPGVNRTSPEITELNRYLGQSLLAKRKSLLQHGRKAGRLIPRWFA